MASGKYDLGIPPQSHLPKRIDKMKELAKIAEELVCGASDCLVPAEQNESDNPMKNKFCAIVLKELELPVHLGWPNAERDTKQTVWLDMHLAFPEAPGGCVSDNLADTYCYDTLITKIRLAICAKEFRLIEHLGHEIYHVIRQYVTPDIKINLRVKKMPPITDLRGGATFHYGDENLVW